VSSTGARVKLISDGDVIDGLLTSLETSSVDVLMRIGGTPEAVLTAAAMKAIGGAMQCMLWPRDEAEREAVINHGLDLKKVYTADDFIRSSEVVFAATGVTDGEILKGVRMLQRGAETSSMVVYPGTVKWITTVYMSNTYGLRTG
jgi:fructose-1,6-bisphosphatase II